MNKAHFFLVILLIFPSMLLPARAFAAEASNSINLQNFQLPTALFTTSTTSTTAPATITLDASSSPEDFEAGSSPVNNDYLKSWNLDYTDTPLSNTQASYQWTSSDNQKSSGKTAHFTFLRAGTYVITLFVTDAKGTVTKSSKAITLNAKSTALDYNATARADPQIIMAGLSPSILDKDDTTIDIIALVRPGLAPLQSVSVAQNANPLFTLSLEHINTLENGDQFWRASFSLDRSTLDITDMPVKWGNTPGAFFIRAIDSQQQISDHSIFPSLRYRDAPAQKIVIDNTKNDDLSYNQTKRFAPQVIMGGISPAIIDIADTSFDIIALIRPGVLPIQQVTLNQGANKLFNVSMEKRSELSNGDQVWVATFVFPPGHYGALIQPITWGTDTGEFSIHVIDSAQQMSAEFPMIRFGHYPAM